MRLIDGDALQEKLTKKKPGPANARYTEGFNDALLRFKSMIHTAPTIEPERRTGRWVKVNGKTAINCSACYHCSWSRSFEDTVKRFNFCPNCGARMEDNNESD